MPALANAQPVAPEPRPTSSFPASSVFSVPPW